MATTPVRWFHSGMANAPVLHGLAGSMISVLDACLKDGFDTKTINSLVVSGGVATATISAGHAYDVHAVIRVAGVTGALSALNDDWRVTAVTGSTLTFSCPGVSDGSATGTMTAKRAPAGWAKPFAATNKAVYQSQNLAATRLLLRVDDTATRLNAVRGYESMTDIDTGSALFPTIVQCAANAYHWAKSQTADSTAIAWSLFADDCAFYFLPEYWPASAPGNPQMYGFGDLVKLKSSDAYHAFIFACAASSLQWPDAALSSNVLSGSSSVGCYLARAASQSGAALPFGRTASMISTEFGRTAPAFSTSVDGNVHMEAVVLALDGAAPASSPIRGVMPGLLQPLQHAPSAHRSVILGQGALAGRAIFFNNISGVSNNSIGRVAFDITGPWR